MMILKDTSHLRLIMRTDLTKIKKIIMRTDDGLPIYIEREILVVLLVFF
jgi:hypothetical protein